MNEAPPVTATPTSAEKVAKLVARRRKIRAWWQGNHAWADDGDLAPPVGLAFSGGGIRSATFCLGLTQGLVKSRDALSRIDILSTVSGGGYAGCFLRSLFVPKGRRGIEAVPQPADAALDHAIVDQYELATAALKSGPNEREIAWRPSGAPDPITLRNPMWWLREHSRYLAPTGPTDYGFAIAYIARNWLAMVYLFMLACAALAAVIVIAEGVVLAGTHWRGFGAVGPVPVSPLFALLAIPGVRIVALVIGYWGTQRMSANERDAAKQRSNLNAIISQIMLGGLFCLLLLAATIAVCAWMYAQTLGDALRYQVGGPLAALVVVGTLAALVGVMTDAWHANALADEGAMLTAQLRLRLTKRLATASLWWLVISAVALIDSLGAAIDRRLDLTSLNGLSFGLLPILAFLIKKLPDWFGGTGKSMIGSLVKRFATGIALAMGVLLYGLLAVGATALVHHLAWSGGAWVSAPRWPRLLLFAGLAWILACLSGRANGFINLSSLHTLYGARLTRAYLGASNVGRLALADENDHPKPITENHPCDYIQPRVYGEIDLPAPIHLVNVTLNETIDPSSQIVARDRKGTIMTLEPGGVRIGVRIGAHSDDDKLLDWGRLTNDPPDPERTHAENMSLGQWIAISGAAASSGMGRMTSLGFALAFTFANVRLGYWWWAPKVCRNMPQTTGFAGWIAQYFGTFVYLANEMTCRYSRGYDRKYLTDGGHYENSGALPLIGRRVPLIIVSDNGADPAYAFEDMQTLIRQVRIDLGGETTILGGDALSAFLAKLGTNERSIFVDPELNAGWRKSMTDVYDPAFALVLRFSFGADYVHAIWIKPRLLPGLPEDVTGYAAAMAPFPQQPTGDQFFDEAQWESYRRLGEETMTRLLRACPKLLDE